MWLDDIAPVVLYDNRCYLCSKFAGIVKYLSAGRSAFVGHYSDTGERIRKEFLDGDALEMFWYIDGATAYGGRAALLPLARMIFSGIKRNRTDDAIPDCAGACRTVPAFFVRSASLITHSKKIKIYNMTDRKKGS